MSFKYHALKENKLTHNIKINRNDLLDAKKWCQENCKGKWEYTINYSNDILFVFELDMDSLLFKVIYGA